jgi:hypothetical protein
MVPAEAVRALWGVMDDKKAGTGVLVTTSYFGKATHDFAQRNERVRLIEGPELKQLISEHLVKDVIPGAKQAPRNRRSPSESELSARHLDPRAPECLIFVLVWCAHSIL